MSSSLRYISPAAQGPDRFSKHDFELLFELLRLRSGICIQDDDADRITPYLCRRIEELDLRTPLDYYYYAKYDASETECDRLIARITDGGRRFFECEPQLLCFAQEVLPELVRRRESGGESPQLRIWSAGCSTGEEPYTLAMILLEQLPSAQDWRIEIIGSDLSWTNLDRARNARYASESLKGLSTERIGRFFVRSGDSYSLKPAVTSLVTLTPLSLAAIANRCPVDEVDVVFCRDRLNFFEESVRRDIASRFYESLRPGGYLFIGHTETMHGVSRSFQLVYFRNALVYHKLAVDRQPITAGERTIAFDGRPDASGAGDRPTRMLDLLKDSVAHTEPEKVKR